MKIRLPSLFFFARRKLFFNKFSLKEMVLSGVLISSPMMMSTLLVSCSRDQSSHENAQAPQTKISDTSSFISIQDVSGTPIAEAQVLIGEALNVPFENNLFLSDKNGKIPMPSTWTTTTPLSVAAKGYVTASFLHTSPNGGTFKLRKLHLQKWVEYSGRTTGYQVFDDYSVANIGLVFEAIKRIDLADFNISKIISPEIDTFSVFGSNVSVPSNLSIPEQTLSYIIPFKIAKPGFRVQLETQSDHLMVGLHAEFPVTDLIRGARNNTGIFEMINFFSFTSLSRQAQRIDDINVNRDVDISTSQLFLKNHLSLPKFDKSLVMLTLSVLEENDSLIPLDVKNGLSESSLDLNSLSQKHSSEKNIAVLKLKDSTINDPIVSQELMSISIQDAEMATLPEQLSLLSAPVLKLNSINLSLPTSVARNIFQAGMYFALSEIQPRVNSSVPSEIKNPLWDVYSPTWEEISNLPALPNEMLVPTAATHLPRRWTANLLGSDRNELTGLGPDRLKTVNYITKSAADLK